MLKSNNLQTVHYYTHLDSYELHNIATTLTLFVMHPYSVVVLDPACTRSPTIKVTIAVPLCSVRATDGGACQVDDLHSVPECGGHGTRMRSLPTRRCC